MIDTASVVTVREDGSVAPLASDADSQGWVSKLFCKLFGSGSLRLSDCLQAFCATEALTGSNQYDCDRCKGRHDAEKSLSLSQPPDVLCVHLKRFSYHNVWGSKVSTYVEFPMEGLDMSRWLEPAATAAPQPAVYDLASVVVHMGGMSGGHYVCYAKNRLNGKWYEFDDTRVTAVSVDDVKNLQA